jgi:hypothetical protein
LADTVCNNEEEESLRCADQYGHGSTWSCCISFGATAMKPKAPDTFWDKVAKTFLAFVLIAMAMLVYSLNGG